MDAFTSILECDVDVDVNIVTPHIFVGTTPWATTKGSEQRLEKIGLRTSRGKAAKVLEASESACAKWSPSVGECIGIEASLLRCGTKLVVCGPLLIVFQGL